MIAQCFWLFSYGTIMNKSDQTQQELEAYNIMQNLTRIFLIGNVVRFFVLLNLYQNPIKKNHV